MALSAVSYPKGMNVGAPVQRAMVVPLFGTFGQGPSNANAALAANLAAGAGVVFETQGLKIVNLDFIKTNTGTCTVAVSGCMDAAANVTSNSTWTVMQFYVLGTAAPAAAVSASVGAGNPIEVVLQLIDLYPTICVVVTASGGTYALSCRAYCIPI